MRASSTISRLYIRLYALLLERCDTEKLILISYQGTFWYHSHFKTQYCDGLRGPLVVYDEHDPNRHLYDVDDGKIYGGKESFTQRRLSRRAHRNYPCGLVSLTYVSTAGPTIP